MFLKKFTQRKNKMTISWKEACEISGYAKWSRCPYAQLYIFHAYKNGEVLTTNDEKVAYAFSSNVEKLIDPFSKKNIDDWNEAKNKKESEAYAIWMASLRDEYSHFSDATFDVCYYKSYEEGHYAGRDEVANHMIDNSQFVERIINSLDHV